MSLATVSTPGVKDAILYIVALIVFFTVLATVGIASVTNALPRIVGLFTLGYFALATFKGNTPPQIGYPGMIIGGFLLIFNVGYQFFMPLYEAVGGVIII
jgi:hypothetical protein